MSPAQLVALVLALAVLAGWIRLPLAHRRDARAPRRWRLLVLLALQPLLAFSLHRALFPPERAIAAGTLTVLSEGATPADLPAPAARGRWVVLPEAGEAGEGERVPDLATALRRYPADRLQVIGAGLTARDREAARGRPLAFVAAPLPRGITRIDAPEALATGDALRITGAVSGVADGRIDLLDPAGRRIDAVALDQDGGFALHGVAFAAGAAEFGLRLRDADGATVEQATLPLWIAPAVPPRVLLLAGAPNPETRALRRWLEDAGARVQARIALGAGVQLGAAPLDDAALAAADLLVVDARAWSGLGDPGRARVMAAVRAGLGLLLRADTPLPAASLQALRGPGFAIGGGNSLAPWTLPAPAPADEEALRARLGTGRADAPVDLAPLEAGVLALGRRAWQVEGDAAAVLGPAAVPAAGWWRGEGRGRIGIWAVTDSYRLPLHGRSDLYSDLWSPAVAVLARASTPPLPVVASGARVGERLALCGLPEGAWVETPDAREVRLLPDPDSGERCAGLWPGQSGWHQLRLGEARRAFFVADPGSAPVQRLAALREATLGMVADAGASASPAAPASEAGPAWPWFLAWLLLATLAWWFERARVGLASGVAPEARGLR